MNKLDISIKDLIHIQKRLTFLVGAGSSTERPSCLAAGNEMKEAIIKFGCEQKYIDDILQFKNLSFKNNIISSSSSVLKISQNSSKVILDRNNASNIGYLFLSKHTFKQRHIYLDP